MKRWFSLGLVALLLWPGLVRGGEESVVVSETVQLRVADGFLAEQEYYRAITEYLRFRFLFPDSGRGDYVLLQIGRAYLRGGEPDRAAKNFRLLAAQYPASPLMGQSRFLEGLALWKGKDRAAAAAVFEELAAGAPNDQAPRALAALALLRLEGDDVRGAREALQRFTAGHADHAWGPRVREAEAGLAAYEGLPQKSEVLAGILSGILPGAGYAYAEEFATGFMSLGVNGAFVTAAWAAFANGLEAVGILAGGIGLPFYIGNIYGSVLSARKWNLAVKKQARDLAFTTLDFVFE
ncbi:MAG: tetratricopeptide repeat protein [Desulfobacterota bacterium]|jgi:tetratricopeptide (TPR) repeat protein|nr:tetratricopeptide repeat protein [Thermodesulfobacteriota bacterium]